MVDEAEPVAQLREWSSQLKCTAQTLLTLSAEIEALLRSDPRWEEGDDGAGTHRPAE